MKRTPSIRSQIALLLGVSAVALLGAAAYAVYSQIRLARADEENRLQEVVELAANGVGLFVADTERRLATLAADPEIAAFDPERCDARLKSLNPVLHEYTNTFLVRADGSLVCSALEPSGSTSAEGAPWWDEAREADGLVIGAPQFGRISGVPVVVFALPLRGAEGRIQGWIGLSGNTLSRFRELVSSSGVLENGVITLAQDDGTVISRSEDAEAWVGRRLPTAEVADDQEVALRGTSLARDGDGIERFWAYRNLPEYGWRVYAGVPLVMIQTAALTRARPTVLLTLGLLALVFVLAVRLQASITAALDDLQHATRQAALGRSETVPESGPSEVGAVAAQFNRTLDDRARALDAERRIRQRYQSILNNAVFGIFISTPEGRIAEANPALARMLGFDSVARVLSLNMRDLYVRPGEREELVRGALEAGRTGAETEWKRVDGTTFPVRLNWSVIRLPDGSQAFEVIAEDLSERRTLEQQLRQAQKLEAVGRLAGGVAHDFNNRLTVISGQAELLRAELPDDRARLREYADAIMMSTRRAAELTSQLLAFSRRQALRPRPVDMAEVARGVDLMIRRLIGEEVELVLDVEPVPPVRSDPGQIEQILLNLCTNARDAMPDGGRITIATEARTLSPSAARSHVDAIPGDYAVLSVTDTGEGMDEETRQRVFEPFFTTKPPGKGTGLGLSMVYGITTQAGGHVRVYSWPGKGTRFEIWLPAAAADGSPVPAPVAVPAPEPAPGGRETVLVAEDEDQVRRILVTALGRAGYRVIEAEDGPTALSRAVAYPGDIHLLVSDVVMPGMRGPELAARLSRRRPGIKILFISGYTDQADLGTADDPLRDFLPKPFTPDELRSKVRDLLDLPLGIHPAR